MLKAPEFFSELSFERCRIRSRDSAIFDHVSDHSQH
ncbi:Uncharacterised protein [Mycobacteroides abscessus subsp. abscessus]|nr:Uncharacterised protein [Mycobacteroides abscessus subsp. abscessus]